MANLVDNALKMSPHPAPPVRVEAGPRADRRRSPSRRPGARPSNRPGPLRRVEPFQRPTDHGTGVGLGLAMTRGLTRAMGGELTLEDTPGGGLTAVDPPSARGRQRRTQARRRDPRSWSSTPRHPILRTLRANLQARGFEVDLAPTGEQALALAARRHPDAVILDLGLPGIDGLEVIRGLRGWTRVPIIVLSARSADRTRSRPSTPAPTTTSPSPSAWTSSWLASGPPSGERLRPPRRPMVADRRLPHRPRRPRPSPPG